MPRAGGGGPPRRPPSRQPSRQPSGGGRCCCGGWPKGGPGPGPRRPYSQRGGGGGGTLPGPGPSKTTRTTRPSISAPSKTSIASKATRRVWNSTSACDLEPFAPLKTLARCTKPQCPNISRRCASVTLRERLRTSSTAGGSLRGDRERPRRGGGERERGRSSRPPRLRPL